VPRFRFEEEPLTSILPRALSALAGPVVPALAVAVSAWPALTRYRIAS
jgi:hypothetical protein